MRLILIMQIKNGIMKGVFCALMITVAIFLISCQGVMPYCTVTFISGEETVDTDYVLRGDMTEFPDVEIPAGYELFWQTVRRFPKQRQFWRI